MTETETETETPPVKKAKVRKKVTVRSALQYCFNLWLCFTLVGLFLVLGIRDKIVLFPMQDTEWKKYLPDLKEKMASAKVKVEAKELAVPGPGGKAISALLLTRPDAKYVYLVSHGNAGNLGHRIGLGAFILSSGQSVILYDYEGYGESKGEAKLANLIPDGVSVYDYAVKQLGYKPEQIILYGESIGCGVTTGIMKERKAKAVVLQSPFTSLIAAGKDKLWQLKIFPDWVCPEPRLDNLAAVKQEHPPLLLIHGDKDVTLPVAYSRTLYAQALEPKRYYEVKGAGHNDIGYTDLPGFRTALIEFVTSFEGSGAGGESK
ncbi:MAG: alpha/beta hydrolase [Cyanobacteria bacterium SZAS LIN-3]|nr:alpha/beta hydrolase [Cyanobacteria bacterium SZAS LIN-3]